MAVPHIELPDHSFRFFSALDALVSAHPPLIDRPRGTAHPRFPSTIYPLDYGHLPGTISGDGSGIDVWIGSLTGSAHIVTGAIVTVDLLKADSEVKVLLGCTVAEMRTVLEWHNRGEQSGLLMKRPDDLSDLTASV